MCVCAKVDPGNTGRVGPTEAALFLKKSGLPDITLGKVGDSGCGLPFQLHGFLMDRKQKILSIKKRMPLLSFQLSSVITFLLILLFRINILSESRTLL